MSGGGGPQKGPKKKKEGNAPSLTGLAIKDIDVTTRPPESHL